MLAHLPREASLNGRKVWLRMTLSSLVCVLLTACGASENDAEPPVEPPVESTEHPLSAQDADDDGSSDDRSAFEPIPDLHEFTAGSGGATVHTNAATIVAGDMRLEVRPNSLKEPQVVQIATKRPEDFDLPMPPGLLVGAGSGTPRDAGFLPVARWYIPLSYVLEPGTTLEVLSWHPQLKTWLNLGEAQVSSAGTEAVFFTMVMGDVVLRKKPVRALEKDDELCPGAHFRLREEWPGKEDMTVGLSTEDTRLSREDAFRYLTDYRLGNGLAQCMFKNEETLGLWHRNAVAGQSYVDEDFLMDPNAAAALQLLEVLVAHEWIDPHTGEPAVQIRVTEAYDSLIEHSKTSSHYHGRALDLTFSPVPPPGAAPRREYYGRLARLAVCAGFDYVLFEDNFHVHASVLPTKIAVLVQDKDGQFGVLSGDLAAPQRWKLHPHRWDAEAFEPTSIAWGGWNSLEVRNDAGEALILRRGETGANVDAASDDAPIRQIRVGTQELRVAADQLYLVNTDGRPSLGSGNTEDDAVAVPTPVQFPLHEWRVIDASLRRHTKTRKAWRALEDVMNAYIENDQPVVQREHERAVPR